MNNFPLRNCNLKHSITESIYANWFIFFFVYFPEKAMRLPDGDTTNELPPDHRRAFKEPTCADIDS